MHTFSLCSPDRTEMLLQTIVEDPLMRHSAILVFANKQDLVSFVNTATSRVLEKRDPQPGPSKHIQGDSISPEMACRCSCSCACIFSHILVHNIFLCVTYSLALCRREPCPQQKSVRRWGCRK